MINSNIYTILFYIILLISIYNNTVLLLLLLLLCFYMFMLYTISQHSLSFPLFILHSLVLLLYSVCTLHILSLLYIYIYIYISFIILYSIQMQKFRYIAGIDQAQFTVSGLCIIAIDTTVCHIKTSCESSLIYDAFYYRYASQHSMETAKSNQVTLN